MLFQAWRALKSEASGAKVSSLRITPTPLTGEASKHPPTSDAMEPSAADPAFFTGSLWLMASGSWQVHFDIDGSAGKASASVPVAAMPLSILPMERPLGIGLTLLGILLVAGIAGIVAAAVGQSRLNPGLDSRPNCAAPCVGGGPGYARHQCGAGLRRLQMVGP